MSDLSLTLPSSAEVVIIGGGVIGVCTAYYLAERGRQVTLVEQGDIASGCSYGNAGLIVPSHCIPLPAPGVMASGLKWLLDAESPFYIKPRFDLNLFTWLFQFAAAATEQRVRQAIPVLRDLAYDSRTLWDELAGQVDCAYEQRGLLVLYLTGSGLKRGIREAQIVERNGVPAQVLDAAAVRDMEACVRPEVVGGVYYPDDAHVTPDRFVRGLAQLAERKGADIRATTEVLQLETSGRKVVKVKTTRGDFQPKQVILAAGSWSPCLVRDLHIHLPSQPAKGYSVTVRRPAAAPTIPLDLGEAWVIATPMISSAGLVLRLAGTLELAGFDQTINQRRVNAIRRAAHRYLVGTDGLETLEIWRGLRPCTPDGLPIIGRVQSFDNVIIATGHGMLGMSLGPVTGRLVSQLVCGERPDIDLTPLRVGRFYRCSDNVFDS
ncbi:MAG: NAD(P)/FAD-dependent oxidoreductase [Gammaproteobacteria bacterium]